MKRLAMGTALGAGLLIAGCGGTSTVTAAPTSAPVSPASTSPVATVDVACQDGASAKVSVGDTVRVSGCRAGTTAVLGPMSGRVTVLVAADPTTPSFRAVASGQGVISLSDAPVCSPGTLCPNFVRFDGTITVTVTS